MISIAFSTILSVLLVIFLGFVYPTHFYKKGILVWRQQIVLQILFPILLFDTISEISLSNGVVLPIILILTQALTVIIFLSISACFLFGFEPSYAVSVVRG